MVQDYAAGLHVCAKAGLHCVAVMTLAPHRREYGDFSVVNAFLSTGLSPAERLVVVCGSGRS